MAQWDFAAEIADLLDRTHPGVGPRSMSEMIEAAQAVVRVGRLMTAARRAAYIRSGEDRRATTASQARFEPLTFKR